MNEILFEASYTRIELDAENRVIILRLIGVINHEDYKNMWNTFIDKVQEYDIQKMIADQTALERSGMESKAWLVAKWFPKVRKILGNDIKIALVTSRSLFTRIGGEYIVNAVRSMSKFDIRMYNTFDAALEWLKEPPKTPEN
ncbi:MAG: STAS/SEC14 domain-containing protein [Microscillaceae bacterium]|nr:STAS/SEC14 domain-containing protein [Microscillaceae bacterium]